MSFNKVSFEDSLARSVVEVGKCLGCGACVAVCPFNCLEYRKGKPILVKECKVCGICPQVCPIYEWSWSQTENSVFGRERRAEEEFGVYRRLVVAQAKDDTILKACQDGGVVTALLLSALKDGLIDTAIVSGTSPEKPLYPVLKHLSPLKLYAYSSSGYRTVPKLVFSASPKCRILYQPPL